MTQAVHEPTDVDVDTGAPVEVPVFIPSRGEHLGAVVTVPQDTSRSVGVVLMTGRARDRAHRNGMWVKAAHALAAQGLFVLRLDYPGVGNSSGPPQVFDLERPPSWAVRDACQFLVAHTGVRRIVLVGTCFGGRVMLDAAPTIPEVDAVAVIAAPVRSRKRSLIGRLRSRIARVLGRGVAPGAPNRAQQRREGGLAVEQRVSPGFSRNLRRFTRRRGRVYLLYGEDDFVWEELRSALSKLTVPSERIVVDVVPGSIHAFRSLDSQALVIAKLVRWFGRAGSRAPGGSGGHPEHETGGSGFAVVSRGAATSLIGTAAGMIAGLVVTMLLTRSLGVGRYGAIAVAASIATLAQAVTGAGLGGGTSRMMAMSLADGDGPQALRFLKAGLIGGLVTGVLGTGIVVAVGLTQVVGDGDTSTAVAIMGLLILGSAVRSPIYGGLRAYRDLRAILIVGVAAPALDVATVSLLVLAGFRDVAAIATGLVAVVYLELVVATWFLRRGRRIGALADTTLSDVRALLAFSVPLLFTQVMYFAINSVDVLLLGILRSPAEAGLYAPVMRLAETSTKVLAAFPVLFVPVATAFLTQGRMAELRDLYVKVTKWGYLLGFPVLLTLFVVPGTVLPLLFGQDYAGVEGMARILVLGYLTVLVTGLNGPTLGSLGAVKPMARASVLGMITNVGLGLVLIPRFGADGAAWSNTLSLLVVNVAFSLILYRRATIGPLRRDSVSLFSLSVAVTAGTVALASLPPFRSTAGAIALAAAAVIGWFAAALSGRPFQMRWREMRDALLGRAEAEARGEVAWPSPSSPS